MTRLDYFGLPLSAFCFLLFAECSSKPRAAFGLNLARIMTGGATRPWSWIDPDFPALHPAAVPTRRHHDLHALAAGLMLAQRFRNDFIRPLVAGGLDQLGNVILEISRQGDVHGLTIIRCERVSIGNLAPEETQRRKEAKTQGWKGAASSGARRSSAAAGTPAGNGSNSRRLAIGRAAAETAARR